ncbi:hypothetical protein H6P81_003645 [Aristolochia fimbriata]|uniref:Uncharacterized protein n=1 Tax=Aristolochia fimbriata TaxID=158543 RepID=A0AAV7FH39_ARIFI|nr:hypothetical protein H6P81_003645 [Aristolochia fimbriata]
MGKVVCEALIGRGEIKSAKSAAAAEEEEEEEEKIKKPSMWRSLRSMLRLSGGHRRRRDRRSDASERRSPAATDSSPDLGQEITLSAPVTIPAAGAVLPSLGDLRRFSSGRRSASWGGIEIEVEVETDAGGASSASRREPSKTGEVWRIRAAGGHPVGQGFGLRGSSHCLSSFVVYSFLDSNYQDF